MLVGCTGKSQDYRASDTQLPVLDNTAKEFLYLAETRLISSCMEAGGWEYPIVPFLAGPPEDGLPMEEWKFDDVEAASREGFGINVELLDIESEAPISDSPELAAFEVYWAGLNGSQQQDWQRAFAGSQQESNMVTVDDPISGGQRFAFRDGCTAEARTAVYGSLENFLVVESYSSAVNDFGAVSEVLNHRAYARVEREWSACMDQRGYSAGSVADAYGLAMDAGRAGNLKEQFPIAVAAAECNQEVGLSQAGEDVRGEVMRDLVEDLGSYAPEMAQIVEDSVFRARDLLDAS